MDFFDSKGEGSQIDYNAFARLCRYKEPEGLPQVQRLVSCTLYPPQYTSQAYFNQLIQHNIIHFMTSGFCLISINDQRKMVLSSGSLAVMRRLDTQGTGFIRRSDMLRALSELGSQAVGNEETDLRF